MCSGACFAFFAYIMHSTSAKLKKSAKKESVWLFEKYTARTILFTVLVVLEIIPRQEKKTFLDTKNI